MEPTPAQNELDPDEVPSLRKGSRVGRYELKEKLGAGGFGSAWRAVDEILGREVCLKVGNEGESTPEDAARFLREVRLASQLQHPNIVTVYDVVEQPPHKLILVMELVRGESLDRRIRRDGALELSHALRVACSILSALHHAHEADVVHRDVKSANVMLGDKAVKLVDFGLARKGSGGDTVTLNGTAIGTPAYMSPEQLRGNPPDVSMDLWGCAVTLFECLTGSLPFAAPSVPALVLLIAQGTPPPALQSLVPGASDALAEVVRLSMHKDLSERYQTAAAFREALESTMVEPPSPVAVAVPEKQVTSAPTAATDDQSPVEAPARPATAGADARRAIQEKQRRRLEEERQRREAAAREEGAAAAAVPPAEEQQGPAQPRPQDPPQQTAPRQEPKPAAVQPQAPPAPVRQGSGVDSGTLPLLYSDCAGVAAGTAFSDLATPTQRLTSLRLAVSNRIEAMQVVVAAPSGLAPFPPRGRQGVRATHVLDLAPAEWLVEVSGTFAKWVGSNSASGSGGINLLQLMTSQGRRLRTAEGALNFCYRVPEGHHIVGLYGHASDLGLHALGIAYARLPN